MNYYIEGTTTPVPGIETNPVTGKGYVGQVISIEHPEVTTGYKVCEDQPTSLTVTNDGKATATVYYEVDTEQTFDYTVNYYIEGTTTPVPGIETNPVTGKGYVGQVISIEHPEVTTGYKVCEDQPTSLTVTNDARPRPRSTTRSTSLVSASKVQIRPGPMTVPLARFRSRASILVTR